MSKIQFNEKKTIKLQNILVYRLDLENEKEKVDFILERMQLYIKIKGAKQIGPLIQYTSSYINKNGEMDIDICIMLQCNTYIHDVEQPYRMETTLRISNCMYCRYIGPEEKLNFAYQKIQLEAFENDIPLKGDSYTIFVDHNEENETIIADVFMERADS